MGKKFGMFEPPETWIMLDELYGAILFCFWDIFSKSPFTSVVQDNAAGLFCCDPKCLRLKTKDLKFHQHCGWQGNDFFFIFLINYPLKLRFSRTEKMSSCWHLFVKTAHSTVIILQHSLSVLGRDWQPFTPVSQHLCRTGSHEPFKVTNF